MLADNLNSLSESEDDVQVVGVMRFRSSFDDKTDLPYAVVNGEVVRELPKDLFIPPRALEIVLEQFEGPLDLLLYLIRKQNLDVLEINVAFITEQYMAYIDTMKQSQLELAAEYLVMAAILAEIKSRMLLPRVRNEESSEEQDPRAELIRRLQQYERFKQAAEDLDELPRMDRDVFIASAHCVKVQQCKAYPDVSMRELMLAFAAVLRRSELTQEHEVVREKLSTRERMIAIMDKLNDQGFVPFIQLYRLEEGRMGLVVSFLAILELLKEQFIDLVQAEPFAAIHVKIRMSEFEDLPFRISFKEEN